MEKYNVTEHESLKEIDYKKDYTIVIYELNMRGYFIKEQQPYYNNVWYYVLEKGIENRVTIRVKKDKILRAAYNYISLWRI